MMTTNSCFDSTAPLGAAVTADVSPMPADFAAVGEAAPALTFSRQELLQIKAVLVEKAHAGSVQAAQLLRQWVQTPHFKHAQNLEIYAHLLDLFVRPEVRPTPLPRNHGADADFAADGVPDAAESGPLGDSLTFPVWQPGAFGYSAESVAAYCCGGNETTLGPKMSSSAPPPPSESANAPTTTAFPSSPSSAANASPPSVGGLPDWMLVGVLMFVLAVAFGAMMLVAQLAQRAASIEMPSPVTADPVPVSSPSSSSALAAELTAAMADFDRRFASYFEPADVDRDWHAMAQAIAELAALDAKVVEFPALRQPLAVRVTSATQTFRVALHRFRTAAETAWNQAHETAQSASPPSADADANANVTWAVVAKQYAVLATLPPTTVAIPDWPTATMEFRRQVADAFVQFHRGRAALADSNWASATQLLSDAAAQFTAIDTRDPQTYTDIRTAIAADLQAAQMALVGPDLDAHRAELEQMKTVAQTAWQAAEAASRDQRFTNPDRLHRWRSAQTAYSRAADHAQKIAPTTAQAPALRDRAIWAGARADTVTGFIEFSANNFAAAKIAFERALETLNDLAARDDSHDFAGEINGVIRYVTAAEIEPERQAVAQLNRVAQRLQSTNPVEALETFTEARNRITAVILRAENAGMTGWAEHDRQMQKFFDEKIATLSAQIDLHQRETRWTARIVPIRHALDTLDALARSAAAKLRAGEPIADANATLETPAAAAHEAALQAIDDALSADESALFELAMARIAGLAHLSQAQQSAERGEIRAAQQIWATLTAHSAADVREIAARDDYRFRAAERAEAWKSMVAMPVANTDSIGLRGHHIFGSPTPRTPPLGDFFLAPTEVTVGQYARFLAYLEAVDGDDTAFRHPDQPTQHGFSHTPAQWDAQMAGKGLDLPVTGVSFWSAFAFAKWAGCRLPSALEWEFAVVYATPFGAQPMIRPFDMPIHEAWNVAEAGFSRPVSVNALAPPSPFRHLRGNVREWTADAPVFASPSPLSAAEPLKWPLLAFPHGKPENPASLRIVKGGSFASPLSLLRADYFDTLDANTTDGKTGFRLAADVPANVDFAALPAFAVVDPTAPMPGIAAETNTATDTATGATPLPARTAPTMPRAQSADLAAVVAHFNGPEFVGDVWVWNQTAHVAKPATADAPAQFVTVSIGRAGGDTVDAELTAADVSSIQQRTIAALHAQQIEIATAFTPIAPRADIPGWIGSALRFRTPATADAEAQRWRLDVYVHTTHADGGSVFGLAPRTAVVMVAYRESAADAAEWGEFAPDSPSAAHWLRIAQTATATSTTATPGE